MLHYALSLLHLSWSLGIYDLITIVWKRSLDLVDIGMRHSLFNWIQIAFLSRSGIWSLSFWRTVCFQTVGVNEGWMKRLVLKRSCSVSQPKLPDWQSTWDSCYFYSKSVSVSTSRSSEKKTNIHNPTPKFIIQSLLNKLYLIYSFKSLYFQIYVVWIKDHSISSFHIWNYHSR